MIDYKAVMDARGFPEIEPVLWRRYLRQALFDQRYVSDLSQCQMKGGFDMHEGIIERRWVAKRDWQYLLFSGINCVLLTVKEHREFPPSRVECYWIAVARYSKPVVDAWIDSLPFKIPISTPWRKTFGLQVIAEIPSHFDVCLKTWDMWFEKAAPNLNCEG